VRVGVFLDGDRLAAWQAAALRQLPAGTEFLLYRCSNSRRQLSPVRHGAYYALNRWSLRMTATRSVPFPPELPVADVTDFASEWDGIWQRLPTELIERIATDQPAVLIKFGLGLLRVPPPERLPVPILSYHHGDPRHFRGRPAGYWEMIEGSPLVGQIVQRLSNRLDAGQVLTFAETKVHPHSWGKTLADAYAVSPLLLGEAVRRATTGDPLDIAPAGRNYRLPSNNQVVKLVVRMLAASIRRLIYGAFMEKAWAVATAPRGKDLTLPPRSLWWVLPTPPARRFLADPFPHPSGGFLAEALRSADGVGEIVHWDKGQVTTLIGGRDHLSYPATIRFDGEHYCIPETVDWSEPRLFRLAAHGAEYAGLLDLPGSPRLLDPTPLLYEGRVYLFGNVEREGSSVLRLWHAPAPAGPYEEHPASPTHFSPAGARTGRAILPHDGRLIRIGQDFTREYGDGLLLFVIEELSPERYVERPAGELRLAEARGPHTLNAMGEKWLFDFYVDRFSPLAAYRRLRARLSKR
jgi:hypothetical protein